MQHLAKIVLLVTAAHLLAPRLHFVLQGASPCEDKQTAQTVQLDTCVRHPGKGLHDVHLGAQHLVRLGKRIAQHALQASSVPTQSKLCYWYSRFSDKHLISVWALCQVIQIPITTMTIMIMMTTTMMTTTAMTMIMIIKFLFQVKYNSLCKWILQCWQVSAMFSMPCWSQVSHN